MMGKKAGEKVAADKAVRQKEAKEAREKSAEEKAFGRYRSSHSAHRKSNEGGGEVRSERGDQ